MKRQTLKSRAARVLACAALALGMAASQGGGLAYADYIYLSDGDSVDAPPAYELEQSLNAEALGEEVDSLTNLTSSFVRGDTVYIADKGKIILTDLDLKVKKVIREYTYQGQTKPINNPSGLFVTAGNHLYACEPDNSVILHFNDKQELVREIGKPEIIGLEDVVYRPYKVAVDSVNRIYVVAKNVYEGIIELNLDGSFSRFFGVNNVKFNPLELMWRSIATEAQREQMQLWLPTDFSNIAIDKDGFIYTTSKGSNEIESLKKLNAQGKDILRFEEEKMRPMGDLGWNLQSTNGTPVGPSDLTAVDCNEYGMYIVMDSKRQRIFSYNEDGELLYVFGGSGTTEGKFLNLTDIKFLGDKIIALDQLNQSIEIFAPTLYGQAINSAVKAQYENRYDDAAAEWQKAAAMNPNFELSYTGQGKAAMRERDYEAAQELFHAGSDRSNYSKAFAKTRADWIEKNFNTVILILGVLVVLMIGVSVYRAHRRKKEGKYQAWDE